MSWLPKSPKARRRLWVVAAVAPVLALAVGLSLYAMRDSVTFFFSPSEATAEKAPAGRVVRLGGLVETGSVTRGGDGEVVFIVTDNVATTRVVYHGDLPDLFREGQGIVAQGAFLPDRSFRATQVLAKHDETYMPREVAERLKAKGEWRPEATAGAASGANPRVIVEVGAFALILSLALAALQTLLATAGRLRRSPVLAGAAEGAAIASAGAVAVAFVALIFAFVASDFSVANVAANSHTDKPMLYKVAGAWGSHEGSLVLWCLVLTGFGGALARARNLPFGLKTCAVATQGLLGTLFLAFAVFTSNPFARLDPAPIQGASLNPLLQDPALAFHPPLLYCGYVGFSVCFSLAVAALIEGRANSAFWPAWGRWVRPWALASWAFLTVGIALGAFWAYYELGWGGWWFWDPVENASFMPWLAGAALLHSAVVTERRGALAGWTTFLALLAFTFSMLGAFLVRSGVLTSVHAFAVDPQRGLMLLAILGATAGAAFALFAWRAPQLKAGGMFAPISREGALVLNNLFLTAAAATVLLGTLYPLILEAASGATISVGPPYFALTFVPLMAIAFLILPAGPLLAWKRGDLKGATQRLWVAAALAVVVALIGLAAFQPKKALSAAGLGLGGWLILGALSETAERVRLFRAPIAETLRRARGLPLGAWGMTLAHAGLGVFVLGAVVETGYRVEAARPIAIGQSIEAGPWTVRLDDVRVVEGPNYLAEQGRLTVERTDRGSGREVTAERRFFPAGGQTTTEVGLDFRGLDDVYVVLGERARTTAGAPAWNVRVWWNPWARLIFLGPAIMALGGVLSLMDRRLRLGVGKRKAGA